MRMCLRRRSLQRRPPFHLLPALVGVLTLLGVAGGLAGALAGCDSIAPVPPQDPPITDPTQLYMSLTVDHPAVNLSTATGYTSIQLTATPRDALGNPMPGLPAPTFISRDTSKVRVTADGLVTVVGATIGAVVDVSLQVGQVTHVDATLVNVTSLAPPPVLDTLSIHPVFPDSAVWSIPIPGGSINNIYFNAMYYFGGGIPVPQVAPRTVDPTGTAIPQLVVAYSSLDPAIATVDQYSGAVTPLHPGPVRVVAQTVAYGVAKSDTATFTVTMPVSNDVYIIHNGSASASFFLAVPSDGILDMSAVDAASPLTPKEVRIAPGGVVGWENFAADSVDVTFDDPTNVMRPPANTCDAAGLLLLFVYGNDGDPCGAGNMLVPPTPPDGYPNFQLRHFPVPGVYPFHSTRTGATGRVVVSNDPG